MNPLSTVAKHTRVAEVPKALRTQEGSGRRLPRGVSEDQEAF